MDKNKIIKAIRQAKKSLNQIHDGHYDWIIGDVDEQLDVILNEISNKTKEADHG